MNFGDSEIGLYHYLVCHEDNFILNSLEKVDLSGYLYRKLRKSGYRRIVFFQNSGAAFQLVTYDRLSYYSYMFPADYETSKTEESFLETMVQRESGASMGPSLSHHIKTAVKKADPPKLVGKTEHKIRITDGQTLYAEILQRFRPSLTSDKIKTAIICPYELFALLPRSMSNETALLLKSLISKRSYKNIILFTFGQAEDLAYFSEHPLLREVFTEFRVMNHQNISDGSYVSKLREKIGDRLTVANLTGMDEVRNLLVRLSVKGTLDIDINTVDDMASAVIAQLRGGDKKISALPEIKNSVIRILEEKLTDGRTYHQMQDIVKNLSQNRAVEELKRTVGMGKVVERMEEIMKVFRQVQSMQKSDATKEALDIRRFDLGQKEPGHSVRLNILLLGNPGTGKTMVARQYGKILKELGILPIGHVVEVSKKDLKGAYVGHSLRNIREKIQEAMGGVLFVDEAYQFASNDEASSEDSFEKEIMEVFLKALEDYRGKFAAVFAGYEKKTLNLINRYEGLMSRFLDPIVIEDYTAEDLHQIFLNSLKKDGITVSDDFLALSKDFVSNWYRDRRSQDREWANVRTFNEEFYHKLIGNLEGCRVLDERTVPNSLKAYYKPYKDLGPEYLNSLFENIVGLEPVKEKIKNILLQIPKRKNFPELFEKDGIGNFLFYGNPGTGKTKVAGLMADFLSKTGILKTGKVFNISASNIIKPLHGGASKAIADLFENAIGGIVVIDELNILSQLPVDAHKVLIQRIEENQRDMCIILTGYKNEFENLLRIESGYDRRIQNKIEFPDYNAQELYDIFMMNLSGYTTVSFIVNEEERQLLKRIFTNALTAKLSTKNASFSIKMANDIKNNAILRLEKGQKELYITQEDILKAARENGIPVTAPHDQKVFVPLNPSRFTGYYSRTRSISYDQDSEAFYKESGKSLLYIKVHKKDGQGYGSGFLISPEGYAVTCNHVVENAYDIEARIRIEGRLGGRDSWHKCRVEKTIPGLDIALIKLEGEDFPFLKLCPQDRVINRGEKIVIMGYPFGARTERDFTVFNGFIASSGDQGDRYGEIYYLNSEAKSGNSGGPILSQKDGEVLGVLVGSHLEESGNLVEEINYMRPMRYFWHHFTK